MGEIKKIQHIESWCFNNGVFIYAVPVDNNMVNIRISNKGKVTDGKILYKTKPSAKDEKWWDKIRVLQLHYYNFYNK